MARPPESTRSAEGLGDCCEHWARYIVIMQYHATIKIIDQSDEA